MQLWRDGNLTHDAMEQTLEEVHQEVCAARLLFRQRKDRLVNLVQYWDRDWFEDRVDRRGSEG
jgi:hypothetical protein